MNYKAFSKLVLFVCMLSFTLSACKDHTVVTQKLAAPVDTVTEDIALPTIMKYCEGHLYVVDLFTEKMSVKIFDVVSHKTLCEFGQRGHGAGEFLHISSTDLYKKADGVHILLYDPMKACVTDYSEKNLLAENQVGSVVPVAGKDDVRYTEIYKLAKGYIATGLFANGSKYAMLDDSLRLVDYQGKYLENAGHSKDPMKLAIANNGQTVFNKDRSRFAEIVYMANELSFYKVNGHEIEKDAHYTIAPLNYDVSGDHIKNNENEGYLSAAYSKENVFALYCGIPESEGIATYAKEVHVFDLDGNLQKKLVLDHAAFQICVNDDATKLYVLYHEPTPCTVAYDLKNIGN